MKTFLIALSLLAFAPAAFAILDTNQNGLSDFWEKQFNNGNLFDETFDPQQDSDADGWTNTAEAAAGTNPFDPNPPDGLIRAFTARSPAVWSEPGEFNEIHLISPEVVTVSWPTLTGKQYSLFFSPDLATGSWLPVDSPFVAQGGETTYHFPIQGSDKLFWRIAVADVDTDQDGLTDHEEFILGTNASLADSDGDGLFDHAELLAGTSPLDQDTDGDGIPDSIDSDPLVSALAFADADGDGIPDADDTAPNEARGPAPSMVPENASGNPLSNLIKDEIVKFVIQVANPAGPAPTAADLAFFLNGTEETADLTPLGDAVGSTRRFVLTWVAKTTTNYPALTLQNLTLRFRDSQQATTWLKLARIDVAEWEGMMGIARFRPTFDPIALRVDSHAGGVRQPFHFSHPNVNTWYRGPLEIPIYHGSSPVMCPALQAGTRYPLLFAGATGSSLAIETILDISSPQIYKHHGVFFKSTAGAIDVAYTPGDGASILPGQFQYLALPELTPEHPGTSAIFSDSEGPIYDRYHPLLAAYGPSRYFRFHSFAVSPPPDQRAFAEESSLLLASVDFQIRAHAPGTLEHPGLPLPQDCHFDSTSAFLAMPPGVWHKIVLKVGPDAKTLSSGIGLWLRKNGTEEDAPQPGFTALAIDAQGAQATLAFPSDGKLSIPENSPEWQQLTSSEGLTLFLKREPTGTEAHQISLHLLPKVESNAPVPLGSLVLLPVEIAPEVLAVNSNFDEGRIDAATGYAIPDCDDVPGVDRKTGAGNTLMALEAVRAHLDGTYTQYQRVTDNLHGGWFGVNPRLLDDAFWDGAIVTIRKIEKIDDQTGYPESGQVRFYAKWGEGDYQYYGIEPYRLDSLAAVNLTEGGINGKPGESVYGSKSQIPATAAFWMEGVRPGKITLEWSCKKGKVELRHVQTFLVETRQSVSAWQEEVRYQIRLQTKAKTGSEVDMALYNTNNGFRNQNSSQPAVNDNVARVQAVYYYYQQLFQQMPEQFMWAGMAKTAAAPIYGGMSDLSLWLTAQLYFGFGGLDEGGGTIAFINGLLCGGQKAIFSDKAWAHRAYMASGISALKWIESQTTGNAPTDFAAWRDLDAGIHNNDQDMINIANRDLLEREQLQVVQQYYFDFATNVFLKRPPGSVAVPENASGLVNAGEWLSANASLNPMPGGPAFHDVVPAGRLDFYDDRWAWTNNASNGMLQIWTGAATAPETPNFDATRRMTENNKSMYSASAAYSSDPGGLPLE